MKNNEKHLWDSLNFLNMQKDMDRVTYRTAWKWFNEGKIKEETKIMPSGSIFVKVANPNQEIYG